MKSRINRVRWISPVFVAPILLVLLTAVSNGQQIIYQPYIQPGDAGGFGTADQMLVVPKRSKRRSPLSSATFRSTKVTASLNAPLKCCVVAR